MMSIDTDRRNYYIKLLNDTTGQISNIIEREEELSYILSKLPKWRIFDKFYEYITYIELKRVEKLKRRAELYYKRAIGDYK